MIEGPSRKRFRDVAEASSSQGDDLVNEVTSASKTYVAMLTELHLIKTGKKKRAEKKWTVDFELIPVEWVEINYPDFSYLRENPQKNRQGNTKPTPNSPYTTLLIEELPASTIAYALNVPDPKNIEEGRWFFIKLTDDAQPKGVKGSWCNNQDNQSPATVFEPNVFVTGEPVEEAQEYFLSMRFSVSGYFNEKEAIAVFENTKTTTMAVTPSSQTGIFSIGVMDVGAASCNLLYNAAGHPRFFYDVGRPIGSYIDSAPAAIINAGPDLAGNPFVVLSHWHEDHYGMALHSINKAALLGLQWVIPGGQATPGGVNLTNSFNVATPVIIPPKKSPIKAKGIRLLRGTGNTINDSGIVLIAEIIAVAPYNQGQVILTGDCMFKYIDLPVIPNLGWIVAPHHGSGTNLGSTKVPVPNGSQGKIAYSYGIRPSNGSHPYKHANSAAVSSYKSKNWIIEKVTAEGVPPGPRPGPSPIQPQSRGNIMMCNQVTPSPTTPGHPFSSFPKTLF